MHEIVLILCLFGSKSESTRVTDIIINERLAGCAVQNPVESTYIWEEKLVHDKEWKVIYKTSLSKADLLESRLLELHSYDTPCILAIKSEVNKAYSEWMMKVLSK